MGCDSVAALHTNHSAWHVLATSSAACKTVLTGDLNRTRACAMLQPGGSQSAMQCNQMGQRNKAPEGLLPLAPQANHSHWRRVADSSPGVPPDQTQNGPCNWRSRYAHTPQRVPPLLELVPAADPHLHSATSVTYSWAKRHAEKHGLYMGVAPQLVSDRPKQRPRTKARPHTDEPPPPKTHPARHGICAQRVLLISGVVHYRQMCLPTSRDSLKPTKASCPTGPTDRWILQT